MKNLHKLHPLKNFERILDVRVLCNFQSFEFSHYLTEKALKFISKLRWED